MMEHVPQSIRMKALREFIGVARHAVIIIAPQDTAENKQAEEMVLKHENNRFLIEHRQHGLVDFNQIINELDELQKQGEIKNYRVHKLDNLLTLVCLMLEDSLSSSEIIEEANIFENEFHARRLALIIEK